MTTTTTENITDEQIQQLRAEAAQHGDDAMVATCNLALGEHGHGEAQERGLRMVVEAINSAEAQAE